MVTNGSATLEECIRNGIKDYLVPVGGAYPEVVKRSELIAGVCTGIHSDVYAKGLVERGQSLRREVRGIVEQFLIRKGYERQEGAVYQLSRGD